MCCPREEGKEGSLTFVKPKIQPSHSTEATITIVNKTFVPALKTTLIKVEDAYLAFSKLLEFYDQAKGNKSGIEQPSIAENARYGKTYI
jgi:UDP-3-O-[3-hydroxymyristoyl] glucosamine N-acyltransferase